jgi:hypothetical protein
MELLYNVQDNNRPILFYHNNYKYEQRIIIKVNDIVVLDKVTTPANWEYIEFELNNDILSFEVYDQYDILEMIKSYKLDENLNNIIMKR